MWFFYNKSFLSIVEDRNDKNNLLVRARAGGHIEELFPKAKVFQVDSSDYRFRSILPRKTVAKAIKHQVKKIDYHNFKNSVCDEALHNAYLEVWGVMQSFQEGAYDPCHQWR